MLHARQAPTRRYDSMVATNLLPDGIDDRIRAGLRVLDAKRPGWREDFDPEQLDMNTWCDCAIGLVCEVTDHQYDAGRWAWHEAVRDLLGLPAGTDLDEIRAAAIAHGWDLPEDPEAPEARYDLFTGRWLALFQATG